VSWIVLDGSCPRVLLPNFPPLFDTIMRGEGKGPNMMKPISVSALPNLRIKVVFSDGAEGSVDLSDLAGQGVFKAWEDEKFFAQVHVGPGRQIRWNDEIELCPDAIYLKLTGKTPEDLFPNLRREPSHAVS